MALDHRLPTIRFPRLHQREYGLRWQLHWDGARANNGDGEPGDDGVIDYDTILAGPFELWPTGHVGFGAGGFGGSEFGAGKAHIGPYLGFGMGPFGLGGFGYAADWVEYQLPFYCRDGVYQFGVVLADEKGNVSGDAIEIEVEVAAVPRPATYVNVASYDQPSNVLVAAFGPSPDLE